MSDTFWLIALLASVWTFMYSDTSEASKSLKVGESEFVPGMGETEEVYSFLLLAGRVGGGRERKRNK